LPATVSAKMSDGTTTTPAVTWTALTTTQLNTAGTYTLTGTVTGTTIGATATVTVTAATALTVTSVSPITVTTVVGTAPVLPATVTATMSDKTTQNVAVTWGTADVSKVGTVTVTGTIAGSTVTASATVNVTAASVTVATISPISISTVAGTAPVLPSTVIATMSDGTTSSAIVFWTATKPSDYAAAGSFSVSGIIQGSSVSATANVTVTSASVADKTPPVITLTGASSVNVVNGATYTDAGATGTDNVDTTVTVTSVITNAAGTVLTKIDTTVAGTYTITYGAKDAAGNVATAVTRTVIVAPVAIGISSVSAINASQLKVTFNQAVNATSAVVVANYALQNADGSSASSVNVGNAELVASDPNSVILTLANSSTTPTLPATFTDLTKTYKVAVLKDVSTAAGTAFTTAITGSVTLTDVTLPVIASVVAVGNTAVDVTFNKPIYYNNGSNDFGIVDSSSTLTMGSSVITGASAQAFSGVAYKAGSDFKTIRITLGATPLPSGTYTVTVKGGAGDVRDTQPTPFTLATATQTFAVTTATAATQVSSVTGLSQTQVDVVFSAAVPQSNITSSNVQWSTDGVTWKNADTGTTVTRVSDTEYKVNFTTNSLPTTAVTLKISLLKDFNGQTVVTYSQPITAPASAACTLSTVTETSDTILTLVFSQPVDPTTGALAATYTLTPPTGTVTAGNPVLTNSNKTVTITYGSHLSAGTYTLSISGLKDSVGNSVTVANQSVPIIPTTQPALTNTAKGTTSGFVIAYTYPTTMSTTGATSITNASNYQYGPTGSGSLGALPNGTVLTSSDGKTVLITLPSNATSITATSSVLQVGVNATTSINVVADAYGNLQTPLPGSGTQFTIAADATPTLAGNIPMITGANTIAVPTTATLANVAVADFMYSLNGGTTYTTPAAVSLTTIGGAPYVNITTATADVMSASTLLTNVYVKTVGTASKTALGTSIAGSTSNHANSTIFIASISSVLVQDANHLILNFNGWVPIGSLTALQNSLALFQNGTAVSTTFAAVGVGNTPYSSVVVTLGTAIDPTTNVTLKTISQDFMTAIDANNMVLTANTTGITGTPALVATTLASNIAGANIAANDNLVITYDRSLNLASINSSWNGTPVTLTTPSAITIDSTGKLTVGGGYNIGQVTGFGATASTFNASIAYNASNRQITITFTSAGTASVVKPSSGALTYTPAATITSSAGLPITTTFKPNI